MGIVVLIRNSPGNKKQSLLFTIQHMFVTNRLLWCPERSPVQAAFYKLPTPHGFGCVYSTFSGLSALWPSARHLLRYLYMVPWHLIRHQALRPGAWGTLPATWLWVCPAISRFAAIRPARPRPSRYLLLHLGVPWGTSHTSWLLSVFACGPRYPVACFHSPLMCRLCTFGVPGIRCGTWRHLWCLLQLPPHGPSADG